MPATKPKRVRKARGSQNVYVPALDGLRALCVIAIMLYHLHVRWLPSGHMGVVVFLVLGGYLASCTVLRAGRAKKGIDLPRLWLKRVRRLWPPLAAVVVVSCFLCVAYDHVLLTKLRPDFLPSLLFANNIAAIVRGSSYFDTLGGTSPLTHLWYLGVDMQFFLVWTTLLGRLCPKGRSSRVGRRLALVLAALSALAMGLLYRPGTDPTRLYYGPDTRAFAPLLGAWLGLAWPVGGRAVRLAKRGATVRALPLSVLAPLALAGIGAVMVLVPDYAPALYRGGMLGVALASVLVIAGLLERRSPLSRLLSAPPLVWLGKRSFGLYLWHFPLFQLLKVTYADTSFAVTILALLLSLAATELTAALIERPLAHGRLPLGLTTARAAWRRRLPLRTLTFVPAVLAAAVIAVSGVGLVRVQAEYALPQDALTNTGESTNKAMDVKDRSRTEVEVEEGAGVASNEELPEGGITLVAPSEVRDEGLYTPVIVADSVIGDAAWYAEKRMPDALIDSVVGRRPDEALEVLKGYLDQGVVGNVVVLDSFSNMPAYYDDLHEMVQICGDRHVYVVNVRIPYVEQERINESLDYISSAYDNVTLIDWYGYCQGHDDWRYNDGEHLTHDGQIAYVDMITHAIAQDFMDDGGSVLPPDEDGEQRSDEAQAGEEDGSSSDTETVAADEAADEETGEDAS